MIKETYGCLGRIIERQVLINDRQSVSHLDIPEGSHQSDDVIHAWWQIILRGGRVRSSPGGTIRALDLFSGVGGLSLGASMAIHAAGYDHFPLAAVDTDAGALDVYFRNFRPMATVVKNVAAGVDYHVNGRGNQAEFAYAPEIISEQLLPFVGNVDLLLAGPPCQGNSNLNNHTRRSDPRNQLYVCTVAAAVALKAQMIVIENVPDVVVEKTEVVSTGEKILRDEGYHVSQAVIKASDLGGAQMRRRHFMVATQGVHIPVKEVAQALSAQPMTLSEVIGDIEDIDRSGFLDEIPSLSFENQSRIDYLFDHSVFDLPDDQRPNCHRDGHTYPSVYGRLRWNMPSPTITTGFMTPGRGRYVHPTRRRVITAREAARIQGFPDTFSFDVSGSAPTKKLLSKWIGDAVPARLGYAAVLAALSSL